MKDPSTAHHPIDRQLARLYPPQTACETADALRRLLARHRRTGSSRPPRALSARDAVLITYADQLTMPREPSLRALERFVRRHVGDALSTLHLLPFYPASSDDGFSVINYRRVDRRLGGWGDIERLGRCYALMFDGVFNHISARSAPFKKFLAGDPDYADHFIVVDDETHYAEAVRPRATPLTTAFDTARGVKRVITTFSSDQIDLNYHNPRVLLEMIDTALYYVRKGAQLLRLDAIAFLWKAPGTPCIHLPQTHAVIKLLRAVLDEVAPQVLIITETNVPHRENISYAGAGDEAHLVYNFALPPLVLHTLLREDARALQRWAARLELGPQATFFNFLASHDGIGLRPVEGILEPSEIDALVQQTLAHRGRVSYRCHPDGGRDPYELNITYFDALTSPTKSERERIRRFMAAESIMLALAGLPGIYFHSLIGSSGDQAGVEASGQARRINRERLPLATLEARLADPDTREARVLALHRRWLTLRAQQPAFDPHAEQRVLDTPQEIFGLLRIAADRTRRLLALTNVSARPQPLTLDLSRLGFAPSATLTELLRGQQHRVGARGELTLTLDPLQAAWICASR